jgi:hypothetical protein
MTRSIQELLGELAVRPLHQALRLEFAEALRASDPERARLIEETTRGASVRASPQLEERIQRPFERFKGLKAHASSGIVQSIICDIDTFLEHGDQIFSLAPIWAMTLGFGRVTDPAEVRDWDEKVARVADSPALMKVRDLTLGEPRLSDFAIATLAKSPYLANVVRFYPPFANRDRVLSEAAWNALIESPCFRRMVDWGFHVEEDIGGFDFIRRVGAPRHLGDIERHIDGYSNVVTTRYEPMNAESRALEAKYGYIPALHAENWELSTHYVLEGRGPRFAPGATPVPEMYEVPQDSRHVNAW